MISKTEKMVDQTRGANVNMHRFPTCASARFSVKMLETVCKIHKIKNLIKAFRD